MKYILTFMFIVSMMIVPIDAVVELGLNNEQARAFFDGTEDDGKRKGDLEYTLYKTDDKVEATFYAKSNSDAQVPYTFIDYFPSVGDSTFYFNFIFSVPHSEIKLYGVFEDDKLPSGESAEYDTSFVKSRLTDSEGTEKAEVIYCFNEGHVFIKTLVNNQDYPAGTWIKNGDIITDVNQNPTLTDEDINSKTWSNCSE